MEKFLSFNEIQDRCELLNQQYQIDEGKFYKVVERWADQEMSTEKKLLSSFQELLQVVSDEITSIEDTVQMTSTCRLGCAFCCYFPIIINGMEAKLMKKAIENFPDQRKQEIQIHLSNYYQKYGERVEQVTRLDFEGDEDFKLKYKENMVPCVMLNTETNQCMAYEIRPIPCRTYVNYTNPQVCEENAMPEETLSFEFLYSEYMGALNEFLQFLYEYEDTSFIEYPNDVYMHDYLVNWFK